jgi:hypothetical protein
MIRFLILSLLLSVSSYGQKVKRIQPGKVYEAGEALYAPRLGFRAVVPAGWTGVLPRESEVFLLTSYTSPAEIFVLGREGASLNQLKAVWDEGIEMNSDIRLKALGATLTGGTLAAEVVAVGDFINKSMRAYAVARCGDSGACVTCLAVMPAAEFEQVKQVANAFMSAASFETPSLASPYADFDWKEFLTGKMVTTYAYLEGGSKESTLHLCADGRFTAKVTKKGLLKNQNPDYKGKMTGTWTVEGIGERGKIHLTSDKGLPPFTAELTIKDEQIYADKDRYFVANSDQCK